MPKNTDQSAVIAPLRSRREVLNSTFLERSKQADEIIDFKVHEIHGDKRDLGQVKIKIIDKDGNEIPLGFKPESTPAPQLDISMDNKLDPKRLEENSLQSKARALWIINYENERSRTYKINLLNGSSAKIDVILIKDTNLSIGSKYIKELEIMIGNQIILLSEGK